MGGNNNSMNRNPQQRTGGGATVQKRPVMVGPSQLIRPTTPPSPTPTTSFVPGKGVQNSKPKKETPVAEEVQAKKVVEETPTPEPGKTPDPDPIDETKYGKIGMEAYSSCWKFKNVKVQKIKYEKVKEYYNPEF